MAATAVPRARLPGTDERAASRSPRCTGRVPPVTPRVAVKAVSALPGRGRARPCIATPRVEPSAKLKVMNPEMGRCRRRSPRCPHVDAHGLAVEPARACQPVPAVDDGVALAGGEQGPALGLEVRRQLDGGAGRGAAGRGRHGRTLLEERSQLDHHRAGAVVGAEVHEATGLGDGLTGAEPHLLGARGLLGPPVCPGDHGRARDDVVRQHAADDPGHLGSLVEVLAQLGSGCDGDLLEVQGLPGGVGRTAPPSRPG